MVGYQNYLIKCQVFANKWTRSMWVRISLFWNPIEIINGFRQWLLTSQRERHYVPFEVSTYHHLWFSFAKKKINNKKSNLNLNLKEIKRKEHYEISKLQALGNSKGKWVGFSHKQTAGKRERQRWRDWF